MICGAYWSMRRESREDVGSRISEFMHVLTKVDRRFSTWYSLGRSRAQALKRRVDFSLPQLGRLLQVSRTDVGRLAMPECGFRLSAWNGSDASVSFGCGMYDPHLTNAVVLDVEGTDRLQDHAWREILNTIIAAFEPEDAMVRASDDARGLGGKRIWEDGWLVYRRGHGIAEHPEQARSERR